MSNDPTLNPETRNLIDGRLVDAETGATFPNVNPATEAVIGVTADATRADMDRAIAAARSSTSRRRRPGWPSGITASPSWR